MAWGSTTDHGTNDGGGVVVASVTNDSTHGTWSTGAWSVGDRVIVKVNGNGMSVASSTFSVTDSLGNTYNEDSASTAGGTTERDSVFSANVSSAGTPTFVKVTLSSGTAGMALDWTRYTGIITSAGAVAAVDKLVVAFNTSAGAASGNTAATTAANELVVGAYGDTGFNVSMVGKNGTGYTERAVGKTSADAQGYIEDKDSGATGVQSAAMASGFPSAGTHWYMHCVVYKLASGGTPSSSESATTLTDTANKIGLNGPADTSTVGEANKIGTGSSEAATLAEQNAIALLTTDAAAFAEQVAITVTAATSDSATLTDTASASSGTVTKSDSDSATLAEQIKLALAATESAQLGESMAVALANSDTATLQELVSVAIAIADAATLTEGATVTAQTSSSDTAAATDSQSVTQQGSSPSASDSATLGDNASTSAAVSTNDIGTLAEQAAIALKSTDVVAMTEQIGLGLIAADSAALVEQLHLAVAAAATDSSALAEVQNAVNAALAAAEAVHVGESATVQVFTGGQRDWVYVIYAPTLKWSAQAPLAKWSAGVPQQ